MPTCVYLNPKATLLVHEIMIIFEIFASNESLEMARKQLIIEETIKKQKLRGIIRALLFVFILHNSRNVEASTWIFDSGRGKTQTNKKKIPAFCERECVFVCVSLVSCCTRWDGSGRKARLGFRRLPGDDVMRNVIHPPL